MWADHGDDLGRYVAAGVSTADRSTHHPHKIDRVWCGRGCMGGISRYLECLKHEFPPSFPRSPHPLPQTPLTLPHPPPFFTPRQYAGTGAMKSGFTRTGKRTLGGLVDDGVKSLTRYYLNNFKVGRSLWGGGNGS